MANTSTIHIKTDFDCKVFDYGQELGTTKADTYFNIELRKGEHELSFVFIGDDSISKTINYSVEDFDCDYRLVVKIAEVICDTAKKRYDSKDYSAAFGLYSLTAEKGLAKAQNGLGECYYFGNGVEIDQIKAVKWYTKAAEQGYARAQFRLGLCYHCGTGIEKNIANAVEWYTKAAEQGVVTAQCKLGCCYEYGYGVNKDLIKAVEWYTKAVEQGDKTAQFNFGNFYLREKDYPKAVEWFTKAAENGDILATFCLISCYKKGLGVEKDLAKAAEWNIKLAEQGNKIAQYNLGQCYERGNGVEKDFVKAVEWYTRAAEQGNKEAQCHLGVCYFNGYGVEKDLTKAVEWYTKAAEQGNPDAQFNLGNCYKYGTGVKIDFDKAEGWYTKAAEQGNPDAKFNLGVLSFWFGGTRTAAEWWSEAAEQGHIEAQSRLGQYYLDWSPNPTKALEWLSKSAEQGNKEAQDKLVICYYELGYCYETGDGVERNLAKTLKWYTKAAGQGHPDAIQKLNGCYYLDYGCRNWSKEHLITAITRDKEDFDIAMDWFTKTAKNGNTAAKWQLGYLYNDIGECYEKGEGVEYNPSKAIEYYKKGAEQGNEDAKIRLGEINGQNKKESIYYLFFDTETTGLFVDEKQSFGLHPSFFKSNMRVQLMRQPHMVQLSWIATDKNCNIISQNDYIIQPRGFAIPQKASNLHGITTEIAKEKGFPIKEVIEKFIKDVNAANTIVGHNIGFDKRVIRTELLRLELMNEYVGMDPYSIDDKESICTMIESVPFCEIPSGNYYHPYKQPKLQELHKKLFGYEFEDAHNSMSDVKATLKCFKEMKKLGWI